VRFPPVPALSQLSDSAMVSGVSFSGVSIVFDGEVVIVGRGAADNEVFELKVLREDLI